MTDNFNNKTPKSLVVTFIIIASLTVALVTALTITASYQRNKYFYSSDTYVKDIKFESMAKMTIEEEANAWITGYLNQYRGRLVRTNMKLNAVNIDFIKKVEGKLDTVRIRFSAELADKATGYFADWQPVFYNGRMICDWTIRLGRMSLEDGKEGLYVISLEKNRATTEDNEVLPQETETDSTYNLSEFIHYKIENNSLLVTFDDGSNYTTVPVDVNKLYTVNSGETKLVADSYQLSSDFTAFFYGGKNINANKVPPSIVYTKDGGKSWITCEIDRIYDISYVYMNMFNANSGVIVFSYANVGNEESIKIYASNDGGQKWTSQKNSTLKLPLKGVKFLDKEKAFFCYQYNPAYPSNLYITRDGGRTFSAVKLPEQKLDSDAAGKKWSEVYKEATVPTIDKDGNITVYLTQSSNGTYHEGKTVAKYISYDGGINWKYKGETQRY